MRVACLKDERGFTLVELLFVCVVLGVLVAIAVASYAFSTDRAYRMTCFANQRIFAGAVVQYQTEHNSQYPPTLKTLVDEHYVRNPHVDECPADNTVHYTYDPSTGDLSCPLHPTTP